MSTSTNPNKKLKTQIQTYASSGLKTSLHGTIYQLQLLMLYMHRGVNNFTYFDLATEMDQAEKFDDVVFRHRNSPSEKWHWFFLQAKHKNDVEKNRIALKDLILDEDGDFSFKKYFISFCKIKANPIFENGCLENFVLCTNTDFDFNLKTKRKKDGDLTADSQKYNEFVNKWEKHLVSGKLTDSILFCKNTGFKATAYNFKSDANVEIFSVIKATFIEKCLGHKLIENATFICDKIDAIIILEQQHSIEEALKLVNDLGHDPNKEPSKTKCEATAKRLLKFKGKLLAEHDFKELQDKMKTKSNLYVAIKCLATKLDNALKEALSKLNKLIDKNSNESKALQNDIEKLVKLKEEIINLRTNILKCSNVQDLQSELQNKDDIIVNDKLKQILKEPGSDLEEYKQKMLTILEKTISELVIVELTLNEDTFQNYLEEFLKKFQIVTNYPDVEQLNWILRKEFKRQFCLLDADLLTNSFEIDMLKWFMEYKKGSSRFLSENNGNSFFETLRKQLASLMTSGLNKAYPNKLRSYNVDFKTSSDSINQFLGSQNQILHISTRSTRLSTIKVLQQVKKIEQYSFQDSYICIRLRSMYIPEIRDIVLTSFSSETNFSLIIIECQTNTCRVMEFGSICNQLLYTLMMNTKKKIVFISLSEDIVLEELQNIPYALEEITDETKFLDLVESSRSAILEKVILFQDESIALNQLIDGASANNVIDEKILESLIESEKIKIGDSKAFSFIGYAPEYYVPRWLHPQKVTKDIFTKTRRTIFMVTNISLVSIRELLPELKDDRFRFNSEAVPDGGIVIPTISGNSFEMLKTLEINYPSINIVWLDCQQGSFFWKHCTKDFDEIENFVDDNYETYVDDFQLSDFGNEKTFATPEPGRKLYVIANDPGVGKSTFITSISRGMKNTNKYLWIVRINLNNHAFNEKELNDGDSRRFTRSLNEIPLIEDFSHFISDMVISSNPEIEFCRFQWKLLKLGLEGFEDGRTPKIIMFFDGFDEISPKYKECTIKLLKELRQTAVTQIWVTTRIHEKSSLQIELESPAYLLRVLSKNNEISFLNNFWQESIFKIIVDFFKKNEVGQVRPYLQNISTQINVEFDTSVFNEICKIAESLISDSDQFSQEIHNLTKNIQLQAFAQVLVNSWNHAIRDSDDKAFIHIPLHLKMLSEIVFEENFKLPETIGLVDLFDRFVQHKFNIYFREKNILVGNVGSDEVRGRDEPRLRNIHSLLALKTIFPDFQWSDFKQINDFKDAELARIGLLTLVSESRLEFVHRSFAEFLVAEFLVKQLETDKIQELLLKTVFLQSQYDLVSSFFNGLLTKYSTKEISLSESTLSRVNISTRYVDTFLHRLMLLGHTNVVQFYIEKLDHHPLILEQILFTQGRYGKFPLYDIVYNPLNRISMNWKFRVVENVLNALQNQTRLILKLLTTFVHESFVVLGAQCRCLTLLQIELLNGGTSIILKLLLKHIQRKHLLTEIFLKNGFEGDGTFFHFCCRFKKKELIPLLDVLISPEASVATMEEIKDLLLIKDSQERTVLHRLACHPVNSEFLQWLNDHFRDITPFLESRDAENLTPLDLAVLTSDDCTCINIFLQFTNKSSQLSKSYDECILYKAISMGKIASTVTLLDWFNAYFSGPDRPIKLTHLLLKTGRKVNGRISLSLASARNLSNTITAVFNWFKGNFSDHDCNIFLIMLLEYPDSDDQTALHQAAYWKCADAVRCLVEFIINNFNLNAQANLFFVVDKEGKTAFDYASNVVVTEILKKGYDLVLTAIISARADISDISCSFTLDILESLQNYVRKYCNDEKELISALILKMQCVLCVHAYPKLEDMKNDTFNRSALPLLRLNP